MRAKGGSAFLVLRQDGASTVQALHFKDKENPEESKRYGTWRLGMKTCSPHAAPFAGADVLAIFYITIESSFFEVQKLLLRVCGSIAPGNAGFVDIYCLVMSRIYACGISRSSPGVLDVSDGVG